MCRRAVGLSIFFVMVDTDWDFLNTEMTHNNIYSKLLAVSIPLHFKNCSQLEFRGNCSLFFFKLNEAQITATHVTPGAWVWKPCILLCVSGTAAGHPNTASL